ncbi:MAG: N-acetyltransferase [Acidimicrobiia bacterium]|nr:N-acetyltransferase [Acidimicrobiia bacterium]
MAHSARAATTEDLGDIAEALALAFLDDPLLSWLFGQDPTRAIRYTRRYFRSESARHLKHRHVYTTHVLSGAACWEPPGHWRTKTTDIIKIAPLILRGIGWRMTHALGGLARAERIHATFPEHYYLATLGVRPDHQRQGAGTAMLAPILQRCDREGLGAYLESSNESNISFYRQHGFQLKGEVVFPHGPKIWPMWRDPRPHNG